MRKLLKSLLPITAAAAVLGSTSALANYCASVGASPDNQCSWYVCSDDSDIVYGWGYICWDGSNYFFEGNDVPPIVYGG